MRSSPNCAIQFDGCCRGRCRSASVQDARPGGRGGAGVASCTDARHRPRCSIVEVNQAQLSEVSADIAAASAKYEYLIGAALAFVTGDLR